MLRHFRFLSLPTILLLLSFTGLASTMFQDCPIGYFFHNQNDRCYQAVRSLKTWAQARAICQRDGGDLLAIPSATFNPVKNSRILESAGKEYWFGLNDRNVEGQFEWNNGDANLTYSRWQSGHPLTGDAGRDADCAALVRTDGNVFKWVNQACTKKNYYACEVPTSAEQVVSESGEEPDLDVTCPNEEWTRVPNRPICVKAFVYQQSWLAASETCHFETDDLPGKGALLNVADFALNDFVKPLFVADLYWISPTDQVEEGEYTNTVALGAEKVTYLPWKAGTTLSNENDCVALELGINDEENKMVEEDCDNSRPFMCQYTPQPLPPANEDKVCPEGWQKFAASETCFKVMGEKRVMWQNARDQCKEMDSDLAVIPDQETLDFVKGIVSTSRYWIGLKDKERNGKFSWLGQDNEIDFQAWRNPPRNLMGDEYCVELIGRFEGMWNDKSCRAKKYFICQKDAS